MTIGSVKMGSEHPIVRQTMTTSDTRDVEATVAEVSGETMEILLGPRREGKNKISKSWLLGPLPYRDIPNSLSRTRKMGESHHRRGPLLHSLTTLKSV